MSTLARCASARKVIYPSHTATNTAKSTTREAIDRLIVSPDWCGEDSELPHSLKSAAFPFRQIETAHPALRRIGAAFERHPGCRRLGNQQSSSKTGRAAGAN